MEGIFIQVVKALNPLQDCSEIHDFEVGLRDCPEQLNEFFGKQSLILKDWCLFLKDETVFELFSDLK